MTYIIIIVDMYYILMQMYTDIQENSLFIEKEFLKSQTSNMIYGYYYKHNLTIP